MRAARLFRKRRLRATRVSTGHDGARRLVAVREPTLVRAPAVAASQRSLGRRKILRCWWTATATVDRQAERPTREAVDLAREPAAVRIAGKNQGRRRDEYENSSSPRALSVQYCRYNLLPDAHAPAANVQGPWFESYRRSYLHTTKSNGREMACTRFPAPRAKTSGRSSIPFIGSLRLGITPTLIRRSVGIEHHDGLLFPFEPPGGPSDVGAITRSATAGLSGGMRLSRQSAATPFEPSCQRRLGSSRLCDGRAFARQARGRATLKARIDSGWAFFGAPEAVRCLLSFHQRTFATAAATICPPTILADNDQFLRRLRARPKNIKSDIL
jgi:hypothetical protein